MKRCAVFALILAMTFLITGTAHAGGYLADDDLWLRTVIHTEEKGPVDDISPGQ